ncbi:hypothetical protein CDL15_Pgr019674 [Punica granatum]|uniref:Uncharacterized protein n=1 Tax=Punica granatum TaxID=22663 RepID=A0A218X630_PUNGR|nr:hypothetical protein CDL15_Pgr019674 [Punica granatum]
MSNMNPIRQAMDMIINTSRYQWAPLQVSPPSAVGVASASYNRPVSRPEKSQEPSGRLRIRTL